MFNSIEEISNYAVLNVSFNEMEEFMKTENLKLAQPIPEDLLQKVIDKVCASLNPEDDPKYFFKELTENKNIQFITPSDIKAFIKIHMLETRKDVVEEFLITILRKELKFKADEIKMLQKYYSDIKKKHDQEKERKLREKTKIEKDKDTSDITLYPYRIGKNGIYKSMKAEDGTEYETEISSTPCKIIATGDNVDTGELLYKICIIDAKKRERVFWKSTSELLTRAGVLELLKDGMTFCELQVSDIELIFSAYLRDSFYMNGLPDELAASKSGWKQHKNLFVVGFKGYRKDGSTAEIIQLDNNSAELYDQTGTLEGWTAGAKELLRFDPVRFKLYASCTPAILSLINVSSFLQEQYGPSGRLKTLTGWFCASVWGNPLPLQINAKSTPKGIEAFVGFNTDLPTFIDELSTNESEIEKLVYTIAGGVGRSTSNKNKGYEMPKTWNTVVLTTGENPILPTNAKTGQLVRDVPLKEGVNEQLEQKTVSQIEEAITTNYGLVRDLYIQEIFANKDEIREIYEEFYNAFPKLEIKNIASSRAQKYYAAIATAGYLIENVFGDLGIDQRDPMEIVTKYFMENIGAEPVFVPDHERAFNAFKDWFMHNMRYFEEDDAEHPLNHERYGWFGGPGEDCICITETQLEKVIKDLGYNYKGTVHNWKQDEKYLLAKVHKKGTKDYKEYKFDLSRNGVRASVFKIPFDKALTAEQQRKADNNFKLDDEYKENEEVPKWHRKPRKSILEEVEKTEEDHIEEKDAVIVNDSYIQEGATC